MARTGSCHFESVSRQAETVSYGEWQEPVLAIFKCQKLVLAILKLCHMVMVMVMVMAMVMVMVIVLVMTMVKEWQEPVLAIL